MNVCTSLENDPVEQPAGVTEEIEYLVTTVLVQTIKYIYFISV